ncbi:hypothetical protein F5I97DRAFT_1971611 [Phlebopus sp. FC_14]|nr:hypothetical protein F5I97DRAFT_1971611 [Phlebopus sp. FC_14]
MNNPTIHTEALVENALDHLESTGALHHVNWMNITELLNPVIEMHNMFDATDEDIVESMMDAKKLWERNCGHDDKDTDVPALGPTCSEALQAALMLRKYVGTFNDPFICKLEVMLGSFRQRTRAIETQGLKDTKMTDYFACK